MEVIGINVSFSRFKHFRIFLSHDILLCTLVNTIKHTERSRFDPTWKFIRVSYREM